MTVARAGRDRLRPATVLAAVLAVHAAWALLYVHRTSFLVGPVRVYSLWDDAMISMTYARSLAEGHGLVWNPGGERIQGFSNLGVTLVMALVHLLPVGPLRTAAVFQLLQAVALTGTLFLLSRLPRDYGDPDPWAGPVTAAVAAVFAPLSIWALQGSDVGLMTAALVTAAWLAGRSYAARGRMAMAPFAVLAVAVVMRVDATLFYAIFLGVAARDRDGRRTVAAAAALLAATWAALLAFGWLYYGDPLPNTYYLKATGAPRLKVLARGLAELWPMAGMIPAVLAAAVAAWSRSSPSPRAPLALLWAPAAAGVAYNTWVGGDWRPDYLSRFVIPGLALGIPLLVSASRWIAALLAERAAPGDAWRRALPAVLVVALAVQMNPSAAIVEWLWPGGETLLRSWNVSNTRHGLYFGAFTTPGTTVALHWAGVPAYFSGRPCVDVLGRSDRHIARMTVDVHDPGHSKWDWDYLLGVRKPDIFQHESRGLARRPDFRRDYLRARTPEGLEFFVRRESLARVRDPQLVLEPLPGP